MGQGDNAVADAHLLGALADRSQEDLGRAGVRVFLQKVMLDLPEILDAQPVGQLGLLQGFAEDPLFRSLAPRFRSLQFVENPEFHTRLLVHIPVAGVDGRSLRRAIGRVQSKRLPRHTHTDSVCIHYQRARICLSVPSGNARGTVHRAARSWPRRQSD